MIYSFTYPATEEHFSEMLAFIVKVGKDSGLEEKSLFKLKLIAEEILGTPQELLEPFRFDRFEKGNLHPVSNSPYPWS
jgi:hypothetical protein